MANNNAPFGIRPIADNGSLWSGQGRMVYFAASDGNNIFLGDPIVPTGATDAFGVPQVTLATAGATNTILGGFIGRCNGPAGSQSTLLQSDRIYRPALTTAYGFVCDDPNQLYEVQEDSVGGFITSANAGFANGNLVAGAGNTSTGFSGWMLQSSSLPGSGNPTFQVKVLELTRGPDNAIGNFARWTVRLNLPSLWNASGY